jgi:hypothetical protein
VTAPTPPDPTSPSPWTDEARTDVEYVLKDWIGVSGGARARALGAVLATLAPHMARQVADVTVERDTLQRRAEDAKALCDAAVDHYYGADARVGWDLDPGAVRAALDGQRTTE